MSLPVDEKIYDGYTVYGGSIYMDENKMMLTNRICIKIDKNMQMTNTF